MKSATIEIFNDQQTQAAIDHIDQQTTTVIFENNRFNRLSNQALVDSFAALPRQIRHIVFKNNNLVGVDPFVLKKAFQKLPPIESLSMSYHDFSHFSSRDLAKWFSGIPDALKQIDLAHNDLGYLSGAVIQRMLANLPAGVERVELADNRLGLLPKNDIVQALSGVPNRLISLDLSHNQLSKLPPKALSKAFRKLPKQLKSIGLSNNELGYYSGYGLARAIAQLPRGLEHIGLYSNQLGALKSGLTKVLGSLPYGLRTLVFSDNALGKLSSQDLANAMHSLPKDLVTLDCDDNALGAYPDGMIALCQHVPTQLNHLSLKNNQIGTLGIANPMALTRAVASLPKALKILDWALNELTKMENKTLVAALTQVPYTLEQMHLHQNGLEEALTPEELAHLLMHLPYQVKIKLALNSAQRQALQTALSDSFELD